VRRDRNLGLVRLLDVAPTVARVLGLELTGVDGRVLEGAFQPAAPRAAATR
jgi:hypothetical protein